MKRRFSSSCWLWIQTIPFFLQRFNSPSVRLSTWKLIARQRKDVWDEDEDGRVREWEHAMLTPPFPPELSGLTAAGKPHRRRDFSVASARRSEGGEVWVMAKSVLVPDSSVQRGSRGRAGGRAKTGSTVQALLGENYWIWLVQLLEFALVNR